MRTNSSKAGFIRGIQDTESLWLDFQLSVVDVPSRVRSPEDNRANDEAGLTIIKHLQD